MNRVDARTYRAIWFVAMLVLLPASAAVWVLADSRLALGAAAVLWISGAIAALVEEWVISKTSRDLDELETIAQKQKEQIEALVETVRENDRIIGILEERNSSLRAELVAASIHGESSKNSSEAA